MMRRVVWLILFLFGLFPLAYSQEVVVDTVATVDTTYTEDEYDDEEEDETFLTDTMLFVNKSVYPADSIRSFRNRKDFSYSKNLDSLLKAYQAQQKTPDIKVEEPVQRAPGFPFFRFLLWTIGIGVVLFVIYRLFLSEKGLFTSPTRNKRIELEDEPVTDEQYLEQQLNTAIRSGNYRLAVRYLYLHSLSKIAERGWLILSPDKTNYQYVKELSKPDLRNDFARITLHYEYAWYGDFAIEQQVFNAVKSEFDQFQQKMKQA